MLFKFKSGTETHQENPHAGKQGECSGYGGTCKTSAKNSAHRYTYRKPIPQGAESPYMQQMPVKRTLCKRLQGTDEVQCFADLLGHYWDLSTNGPHRSGLTGTLGRKVVIPKKRGRH